MKNSKQLYDLIKSETGLTEEEFRGLAANNIVVKALNKWLKERAKAHEVPRKVDYDSPSWAFKQADAIGYARALQELSDLTE